MSVCPSVRSLVSKTTRPNFTKFLHVLPVAVARSSSDNSGIRYVLPVLLMTSCFPIMGYIARGVGSVDVGALLKKQVVIIFIVIRQRASRCLALASYIMV